VKPCKPKWHVDRVNWFNHMALVDQVCSKLWSDENPRLDWPAGFGRLLSLLGQVTKVVKWDDGDGKASIGHRRDLVQKEVLVAFSRPTPGSFWFELELGKRSKSTSMGLGRPWHFLGRTGRSGWS
jgi:hypothetical protein